MVVFESNQVFLNIYMTSPGHLWLCSGSGPCDRVGFWACQKIKTNINLNKDKKQKMRNEYVSRRGASYSTWSRNRNTVRHSSDSLGTLSLSAILGMLLLVVGLIYLTQGAKATSYDYELSQIDDEISELTAQKEDLAVEKARLTSVAAAESSEVAANMENATVSGYASE